MPQCPRCGEVETETDEAQGFTVCLSCGRVLEDVAFASDVQFTKGADGEGEVVGQFVSETGQPRGLTRMPGGARLWGQRVSHATPLLSGYMAYRCRGLTAASSKRALHFAMASTLKSLTAVADSQY